ncbi:bile salt sulfotransferase isoform X2 [Lingula anatina]|nr:bile salt sulfotransferase isoform X2 [Lingula anatina]XP_013386938.1 bile salt sulfotransferase isoform X2 [Lingula anatina]|eukprot:XP_013386937.1 bile salt sulfotransferase isoform X2 [Lingula anatina]
MVFGFISAFFRRLYLTIIDLYTLPELRPMLFGFMKQRLLGGGANIEKVHDGHGGIVSTLFVDGVPLPPFPSLRSNLRQIDKFQVRSDDIWIVNWPKSGTHWMWEVVMMLSSGQAQLRDSVKVGAMFPEACTLQATEKMTSPRVLDTHVPFKLFPKAALKSKIIYTVRNPKDACVSAYHHQKGMAVHNKVSWEGTFELVTNGKAHYGDWFDHVEEWLKVLENNPNALIVTYEDMKMDLKKQVRRVAEFLGYKRSEKFYDDVAKLCSFGNMKKEKRDIKSAWSKESAGIYRKGTVGDWKNYFTVAQNEKFNEIYNRRMKNINLDLKFEL